MAGVSERTTIAYELSPKSPKKTEKSKTKKETLQRLLESLQLLARKSQELPLDCVSELVSEPCRLQTLLTTVDDAPPLVDQLQLRLQDAVDLAHQLLKDDPLDL